MLSPWWSMNGTLVGFLTSETFSFGFLPGSSTSVIANGNSASVTYASVGWGPVGTLYEGVLAIGIAVMLLSLIGGVLAFIASIGRIRNPSAYRAIRNSIIVVGVLAIVAVAMVPVAQPYAFGQSSGGCSSTGVSSPCSSFWGSLSESNGTTVSWGADVGWYLGISAGVLSYAGLAIWLWSVSDPWGRPSPPPATYTGPTPSYPASGPTYTPVAPSAPTYPSTAPPQLVPAERYCTACGTGNSRVARFCARCGGVLPPPPV